jgi:hypothetical protein
MPLSWNEIKHRAIKFGNDWKTETREAAERQTFWNEFFDVFGIRRRTVASFEEPVRKLSGNWGAIDVFWPGKLLGEHKSAGQDLDKAHAQGMAYVRGLVDTGREREVPRYLIVSDFQRIAIHDLEGESESVVFPVTDLHRHIRRLGFVAGYKQHRVDPEDPANIEAAELMAELHDALHAGGYCGHDLRVFLVRVLFCNFADDTGIFPADAFKLYLTDRTAGDGSDLGPKLDRLFRVLNTPEDQRQANLDDDLRQFPYVNGQLFEERIEFADCDTAMRSALLQAASFRWERISPAVFGSLFQGVMDPKDRRQVGAHYTSEANILKLIRSLFLDDLRAEFEAARRDKSGRGPGRLLTLQKHLASLRFLDPACGCGNFLVITYRELRRLELEILKALHGSQQELTLDDVNKLSIIDVDQMYGIEIEEFPARIAEVALWLTDHQANIELSNAFSQLYLRIPLRKSPHIHVANALRKDWREVLPPEECRYVLGNPPFVGKHLMTPEQGRDIDLIWGGLNGAGFLDLVSGWYRKGAEYIHGTKIKAAFVSTNSITQGEQPGVMWPELFNRFHLKIHFAHRTFNWQSEARGKAHVHCVIIGFACFPPEMCEITDYEDPEHPTTFRVSNISPYLIEGSDFALPIRRQPICRVPPIVNGNKPADGGFLIVEENDYPAFIEENPTVVPYLRRFVGAEEYLNGGRRWALWLVDAHPNIIKDNPGVRARVAAVREFRLKSTKESTRRRAERPSLFDQIRQPNRSYILIPAVSSERRRYVPIGFLCPETIPSNLVNVILDASVFHFGILTSTMHMAWMRQVAGRLKSDYRYSNKLVYNNYPWPEEVSEGQKAAVEKAAEAVLAARAQFPSSTLADLYDPVTMPPALAKAHADLDRAVDRCYRKEPFANDRAHVEHLFALYEKLTAPLAVATVAAKRIRNQPTNPKSQTNP